MLIRSDLKENGKMQAALAEAIQNAKQMIDDANQSNTPLVLESEIRIKRPRNQYGSLFFICFV